MCRLFWVLVRPQPIPVIPYTTTSQKLNLETTIIIRIFNQIKGYESNIEEGCKLKWLDYT